MRAMSVRIGSTSVRSHWRTSYFSPCRYSSLFDTASATCNSYTGATVRGVSAASMTGFGGGPTSKDRYWAPTSRQDSLGDPPDFVGVWLRTTHVSEVGGLFGELTIVKTSVFRIQPDLAG